jgi:hypothetical protein
MSARLRIEPLVQSESPSTSAPPAQADAVALLKIIAEKLQVCRHLIIEGHTDAPLTADGYTNFELARTVRTAPPGARATACRMPGSTRSGVCGCPQEPADPMDVTNRRISIVVKFLTGGTNEPASVILPVDDDPVSLSS